MEAIKKAQAAAKNKIVEQSKLKPQETIKK